VQGQTQKLIRVLYADDPHRDRAPVREALRRGPGFALTEVSSLAYLETVLRTGACDVVLSDVHVMGLLGLDVIHLVRLASPGTPVVIMTGTASQELAVAAMKAGASDFVSRTTGNIARLPETLRDAMARHRETLDRERVEERLRDSEAKLALALEAGRMGVWRRDLKTGRLEWTALAEKQFGLAPGEFDGTYEGFMSRVHPDDRERLRRLHAQFQRTGVAHEHEFRVVWPDGSVHWVLSRGQYVLDEQGQPLRASGASMDIDDRKRAEETARRQQFELAHLLRVNIMSEMASGLAHEITQPLTAISNFAGAALQLDADGKLSGRRVREVLVDIDQQARRAAEVIRRLRAFMRKRPGEVAAADLNTIVSEALALMEPELRRARVGVNFWPAGYIPPLMMDAVQIQQVVANLVQNAVDAMDGVAPDARTLDVWTSLVEGEGRAVVHVCDNGRGIPPEHLHRIFDSFFSTKPRGLGMGLNISRSIVESHGGGLEASNNPGAGATFEFTLPLQQPSAPGHKPTRPQAQVAAGHEVTA
jgi:PAS domain S-box-containing protein